MNRITSVYLDFVRFSAAVVVLLVHARHERFTSGWLLPFKNYGNDAVVVFFVLSGFVIAYCVDQKEKTLADYAISRLSRLYSVVIPALLLTVALDTWGYAIDPSIYTASWFDDPVLRFTTNLFFVSQLWFADFGAFSNGSFWSLGYEFWYYVVFGVMAFMTGTKRKLLLITVAAIIGPKILLLLPVWLMGVWAYSVTRQRTFTVSASLSLFIGSILIYVGLREVDLPLRLDWGTEKFLGTYIYEQWLAESRHFLSSYITGGLITVNFIGFSSLSKHLVPKEIPLERAIRFLASYTFTLYLLHYPLLNFFAALLHDGPRTLFGQALLFLLTLTAVLLIGNLTEHRKAWWRALFERLAERIASIAPSLSR
jgi:peptidoglycan/LPS O-acetylase OafA/YrhL